VKNPNETIPIDTIEGFVKVKFKDKSRSVTAMATMEEVNRIGKAFSDTTSG
jgi:hypothetical protein